MNELVFEVTEDAHGGYSAECLTEQIFTQADDWVQLRAETRGAVAAFFFDGQVPQQIRLHLVRNEILSTA
ncbi:MAG: 2-phospho-L-lactate guanylyltransferase [Gemmatimonadetes bacterium]|jgi:hypothetical protein|nr:2-phospho-L-lactate guanylyltransferase [Gemmatimonadota bacterium]